jgi:hypothetical protein
MREFMNITKALADQNRIRTLLALRRGELCVCQITELFGFAPIHRVPAPVHSVSGGPGEIAQGGPLDLLPTAGQARPGGGARGTGLDRKIPRRQPARFGRQPATPKNSQAGPRQTMPTTNPKMKPTVLILRTGSARRSHTAEGILRAAADDSPDVHKH